MDLAKLKLKLKLKLKKKKLAIKAKLKSKSSRLRLTIYKSCSNIHAQVIDDKTHHTLCSSSTIEKVFRNDSLKYRCNVKNAETVGLLLAKRISKKNINNLVLDRNGYKYHGIIKKITDVLRESGVVI